MITLAFSILVQVAAPQDPPVLGLVSNPDRRALVDAEVVLRMSSAGIPTPVSLITISADPFACLSFVSYLPFTYRKGV